MSEVNLQLSISLLVFFLTLNLRVVFAWCNDKTDVM